LQGAVQKGDKSTFAAYWHRETSRDVQV
jgi:hypothetical protein